MSRKPNLVQTAVAACTLCPLLLSTAWAAVASVHVAVIHPKVSVVIVKNVSHPVANTPGDAIGGQSSGAGAGKVTHTTIVGGNGAGPAGGNAVLGPLGRKTTGSDPKGFTGAFNQSFQLPASDGGSKNAADLSGGIARRAPLATLRSMEGVQIEIIDVRAKLQRHREAGRHRPDGLLQEWCTPGAGAC
jgi:hypothetical protein